MNYTIYRANKTNTGAATRLEMTKNGVFIVSAKQTGVDANDNANFGWSGKEDAKEDTCITMKLGLSDIGELLAVLRGKKNNVGGKNGLYHQNTGGNTTLSLVVTESEQYGRSYMFRIASKKDGGKLVEIKHGISLAEGTILETILGNIVLELVKPKFKKSV